MKSEAILIGIDLGTSSCKTIAFDINGNIKAAAKREYPVFRENGGIVEQNAEDYIEAVYQTIDDLKVQYPDLCRYTTAIGLTGQCPTETFLDKNGTPMRRMITWSDTRASVEAEEIRRDYSEERLFSLRKIPVSVSASWTDARLLWIRKHEPEVYKNRGTYIMAKDYIGYCLTGNRISELWSMKTICDMETGDYSDEYLSYLGYSKKDMPYIRRWDAARGVLCKAAAERTGLSPHVSVSVGCGDALASILGSGTFERTGIAFNSAGTSEIVGLGVEHTQLSKEIMTIPAGMTGSFPLNYGPTQSGSGSLLWLMQKVLHETDFEKVVAEAEKTEAGCGGMYFVPYLAGERAPLWNTSAKGSFNQISINCDSGYFARAVMEGVGFSVRHVLEYCSSVSGTQPNCLRISGGGSRTKLWCKIKADICGLPVQLMECMDASALGAAMTAAIAVGIYRDSAEATENMVKVTETIEPDVRLRSLYDSIYAEYLISSEKFKIQ